MKKRYKLLSEDTVKSLIDFLDEIQFDAAKHKDDKESMQIVNFCTWAIQELLNSYDALLKDKDKPKPNPKSRDDYIEETFMDWNLPEMSDKEFEKLVDTFDNFLRAWEKEYLKKNPKKKRKNGDFKPRFKDVVEHCSLDEIKDMLLDDPELTKEERFDLYYEEYERVQKEKLPKYTLDELCKKLKINLPPKDKQN